MEVTLRTNLSMLTVLLLLFSVSSGETKSRQTKPQQFVAYLTASSCTSTIGGTISSALRERIRSSSGYMLADAPSMPESALGPEILLMCTDLPQDDPRAAVSYLISFRVGRTRDIAEGGVDIVGRARVDQEAQSIFSKFDNWWTEFSATQKNYPTVPK